MKTTRLMLAGLITGIAGLAAAQDGAPSMGSQQARAAEIMPLAQKNLLLAITRAGQQLVAAGDRGTILLSGDGKAWEQVQVPVNATLTALSFADAQSGWAVGHDAVILHTGDGGRHWHLQHFQPKESQPILGVLALSAERAYAVGAYGTFLATRDGGASWSPVEAPAVLENGPHLNALIRLNNGDLFIAGEAGLLAVQDGGKTWRRLSLPYEGSLFGALPRGERGALVYGLRGNVFVTADVRGSQWTRLDTGTLQSLFGGALLPGGEAVLVGADGAVLIVGADNKVRRGGFSTEKTETAASYAGVLPLKNDLLVVSEFGVGSLPGLAR